MQWGTCLSLSMVDKTRYETTTELMNELSASKHRQMERALEALRVGEDEAEAVDRLPVRPHRPFEERSFYDKFVLRDIRVDRVQPGFLLCSFTVPPRLTDRSGNMAAGAVVTLVDMLGAVVNISQGQRRKVSVDMNIAFLSPANLGDELEIRARVLGTEVGMTGTHVLLTNKATGQVVAEGRHSLFGNLLSKI